MRPFFTFTPTPVLGAAVALCLSLVAGCSDDSEDSLDVEGCEHLQQGPAVPTVSGGAIGDDHQRYDLTLNPSADPAGVVTFASSREDNYFIFLSKNVPMKLRSSGGSEIASIGFADGSPECAEIAARWEFHMGVGTHDLVFGPTSENSVSIVIEGENAPE
jgi:hypothetical protein